ncbi:hypothetical protein [Streptomyces sp. NPDC058739]|uniref:hypothetical protein n=1 Tax=Streptomyces sp. NPDC058739 TaxID=3346618 RepID=UPI0036C9E7C7
MSLLVDVFVRDADGEMRVLDVPDDVYRSGGFESWRTTVWGSEVVRSLGARFLPVLAETDLEVEADQVPEFRSEVALLRAHLEAIARETARACAVEEQRRRIEQRLRIMEDCAGRAAGIGGGVLVW